MSSVIPPPPPPNKGGYWKWWAIGCGGCGCLFIIATIFMVLAGARNPNFRKVVQFGMRGGTVSQNMVLINEALIKYDRAVGHYPKVKEDLTPTYLKDLNLFTIGTPPDVTEIEYIAPEPGASPSTIVLRTTLTMEVEKGKSASVLVRLRKDGQVQTENLAPANRFQRLPDQTSPTAP